MQRVYPLYNILKCNKKAADFISAAFFVCLIGLAALLFTASEADATNCANQGMKIIIPDNQS
ncbi:hypothetical protein B9T34_08040 [Acinetobacter sp. ANC 3813]|nr:hypothetical protein B9T34_08040 [Acinetobacter sp. ANC 3813]